MHRRLKEWVKSLGGNFSYIGMATNGWYRLCRLHIMEALSVILHNSSGDDLVDYQIYGNSTQSILPVEYQQVEWLESTGTQYIDIGYKPNNTTEIEIKVKVNSFIGDYTTIYGSRNANNSQFFLLISNVSKNVSFIYNQSDSGTVTTVNALDTLIIKQKKAECYINNNLLYTFPSSTFQSLYNMYLFRTNNSDAGQYPTLSNMYYCKIFDNNVLIRNLIPCKRIIDNVAGMYDTVNNVFYTNAGTGTFISGPATPTIDTPNEIKSVGDKTANLFNKANAVDGFILTTNGTVATTSCNNKATDYILVTQDNVTISGHNYTQPNVATVGLAWYDVDKAFISSVAFTSSNGNGTYTKPSNAVYCRYTVNTTDLNTSQFEVGTSASTYVPFGYKVEVVSRGKNLVNVSSDSVSQVTRGTITPIKNGIKLTSTGVAGFCYASFNIDDKFYKIIRGKTVTLKMKVTGNKNPIIKIYTNINGFLTTTQVLSTMSAQNINTFTFPLNFSNSKHTGYSLVLYIDNSTSLSSGDYAEFSDVQLELSTSTPFEPYTAPITTTYYLNEPLRAIETTSSNYNVVANGKYYISDYIDKANGKVVRNVGIDILNGTVTSNVLPCNLVSSTIGNDLVAFVCSIVNKTNFVFENMPTVYSTKMKAKILGSTIDTTNTNNLRFYEGIGANSVSNNQVICSILKNRISGWNDTLNTTEKLNLVKAWLSSNPIDIHYILDTPTEESITALEIPTIENTTIIEFNTEVQPTNMYVKYYAVYGGAE
jgi:hypothetical protein